MTHKQKILALLQETGEPLCDACIRVTTGIDPHPAVNQAARQLAATGVTTRAQAPCSGCGKTALCNAVGESVAAEAPTSSAAAVTEGVQPWHWEGHVQAAVVEWLKLQGWEIVQAADTAAKTAGVDIIARRPPDKELWVTVKGFPLKSKYVQARHWFAGAIFDVVTYRDKNAELYLAIALPDGYATYRGLASKIGWLKKTMPFTIFWVGQDGFVRSE